MYISNTACQQEIEETFVLRTKHKYGNYKIKETKAVYVEGNMIY